MFRQERIDSMWEARLCSKWTHSSWTDPSVAMEKQSAGDGGDECVASSRSRRMRSMEAPLMVAWLCALMRLPLRLSLFASTTKNKKRTPMSAACGSLRMDPAAWWLMKRCW